MFSKIVVGVDAREGGRDALALAAALAQVCDSELIAVHAYPYHYFVSRGADAEFEAVLHGGAEETLRAELDSMEIDAEAIAIADARPAARCTTSPCVTGPA